MAARLLGVGVLVTLMTSCWGQTTVDLTRVSGASGTDVVETVIDLIQEACIFPGDKLFFRRAAWVATRDGLHANTFRARYHGGIWQVSQRWFAATQNAALNDTHYNISRTFQISWTQVSWSDCRKPLYSAIAAIVYITSVNNVAIPTGIPRQGQFYHSNYNGNTPAGTFIAAANQLYRTNCRADIIFVLDASGSVGRTNFGRMLDFVKSVITAFNMTQGRNRIGVIKFSSSVQNSVLLGSRNTKASTVAAVEAIRTRYRGGGTATHLALAELVVQFNRRARRNVAKVAIVVTDGYSNSRIQTESKAGIVHNDDITVFAVGVGRSLNHNELRAIASRPTCQHLSYIQNFLLFEELREAIEKRTCDAPLVYNNGNTTSDVGPGETQRCRLTVGTQGITVKIITTTGTVIYYIGTQPSPGPSLSTHSVTVEPGITAVIFIRYRSGGYYCSIRGGNFTTDVTVVTETGNTDHCGSNPCPSDKVCRDTVSSYICIDPCSPNYCNGHGSCHAINHNAVCTCARDWTGPVCDVEIPNPCRINRCQNGGTCTSSSGSSYTCICAAGWDGRHCTRRRHCMPNPCLNLGICTEQPPSGYTCDCPVGFMGDQCQTPNPCRSSPCLHGSCNPSTSGSSYTCSCYYEWTGTNCDSYIGCNQYQLCYNGGTCRPNGNGFTCTCPPNYSGEYCHISNDGYTCGDNVCTWFNIIGLTGFYLPHKDPNKFIQCDEHGGCHVMPCSPGTSWNVVAYTCVDMSCSIPPAVLRNPCDSHRQHGTRFPVTFNPSRYVICTNNVCESHTCPNGAPWTTTTVVCPDDSTTTTASPAGNTCTPTNNPCRSRTGFPKLPHATSTMYIWCMYGYCYNMHCPAGTTFGSPGCPR